MSKHITGSDLNYCSMFAATYKRPHTVKVSWNYLAWRVRFVYSREFPLPCQVYNLVLLLHCDAFFFFFLESLWQCAQKWLKFYLYEPLLTPESTSWKLIYFRTSHSITCKTGHVKISLRFPFFYSAYIHKLSVLYFQMMKISWDFETFFFLNI